MDAIIIPEIYVAEGFLAECKKIEKESYVGDKLIEAPRLFKKEVFFSLGGFDEKLVFGEDSDLYFRLEKNGYKTLRIKSKIKHHEGRLSFKKIILRAYIYGKSLLAFVKKNPSLTLKKYSPLHQWYIKNLGLIFRDPHHYFGLFLIKIVEYTAYFAGVIAYLLKINENQMNK